MTGYFFTCHLTFGPSVQPVVDNSTRRILVTPGWWRVFQQHAFPTGASPGIPHGINTLTGYITPFDWMFLHVSLDFWSCGATSGR
jgi:hypothetical protein